jgi:ubiquinone biosynthesis protein
MAIRFHLAYKNIKRLRDIVRIMFRHGFKPLLDAMHLAGMLSVSERVLGRKKQKETEELTSPVRLRLALEELGPTFIKFGQILSTRPDILPQEYISELLKLQDSVPALPFKDVAGVIEREFKKPVSELFLDIEENAVAAASIAQVHRATTLAGEEVVVKIKRPGIERTIDTDTAILNYLARLSFKYIPETRIYDPVAVVEEFARVIKRELDLTLEASFTEKFRANFSDDPRVTIPKVYWDITGKSVLTMQRISGIKVSDVARLKERNIEADAVARLIAETFFRQVFEFSIFHGDLHSGNIFVLGPDSIALVDFGIVGRIDAAMKEHLAEVLIGFVTEDFERLVRVYLKMGIIPEGIDKAAFEAEYYDMMQHYFGRPFKHVRMGELMMDYIKLASRYKVRLPKDLLLFDKCLLELEGLARVLYPDVSILKESEPYAKRLYKERVSPTRLVKDAVATLYDYKDMMYNYPQNIDQIMKKIIDDKMRIEFMHRGLEDFIGEVDRSSNRLTFGLILAALIVGSSLVMASDAAPLVFGFPAFGLLGFVVASLLGFWLAFQILKSGKF